MGGVGFILKDGFSPVKINLSLQETLGRAIQRSILFGSAVPWLVERDRQLFLIMEKILVRGKNRDLIPHRDRTDQEIDLGALNPGLPAGVVEFSGPLVIRPGERQVFEWAQFFFQDIKLLIT